MTITCIIPAFNEAARIAAVLAAVTDHPMIDQIIVVDDGSTDGSRQVLEKLALKLIFLYHLYHLYH
jgi:glycosyltransferase involved in cell wall biosynthesis